MAPPPPGESRPPDEGKIARRLGRFVESEARRVLSERHLTPDPVLVAEGWKRRFLADGVRADEAVALYHDLGFEVRAVPVQAHDAGDECGDCQLLMQLRFKTIYTRRPEEPTT